MEYRIDIGDFVKSSTAYRDFEVIGSLWRFFYQAPPFPLGTQGVKDFLLPVNKDLFSKSPSEGKILYSPLIVNGIELPAAVFTVEHKNNIVFTPVTGFKGTVKEFMGSDDYYINVVGVMLNKEFDSYPLDLLKQLQSLEKSEKSMEVINPILNELDIHKVVCSNFKIDVVPGAQDMLKYTMTLVSDFDYTANVDPTILY